MPYSDSKFIYWLLGATTTVCLSLASLAYHSVDVRITALESQHDNQEKQQTLILERLATVTANQQTVMHQLDIAGTKMDDIYKIVYRGMK